jgi:hypothetical protein
MRTQTLEDWHTGVRLMHIAHSRAASSHVRLNRALGVPVVIVTTVVGTTVFASLGNVPNTAVTIVVGVFSVAAAILSSLQTFLNHSGSAERHNAAAIKYGMLRRELEQFLDDTDDSRQILKEFMASFRARWDQVDQESPALSERIHESALAHLRRSLRDRDQRLGTKSVESLERLRESPAGKLRRA